MGKLYLVATPIGNLEDVSPRALRVLQEVHMVACEDTRHTQLLLRRYEIRAKHLTSFTEFNSRRQVPILVGQLDRGWDVALVSDAGTPGISDPGFLLVRQAREAGIPVVPVPGPSAVVAALSAAGVPADRFVFAGFLPVKPGRRFSALMALREVEMTVVCYESPHRLLASLEAVAAVFGEVPMVLARELTKQFEEIVEGTPQALSERFAGGPIRGEFTLIIPYTKRPCASPEP